MIKTFLLSIASTVFSGIVLAFIFFFFREKVFSLPNISGIWNIRSETNTTEYNPYQNLELRFVAMLCCGGSRISGTIEKVYEKSSTGKISYTGKNRTRGEIDGFVEKRYFSKDRVKLHIIEHGQKRDSTMYHELIVERNGQMKGSFSSTAADSKGDVTWQRDAF